MYWYGCFLHVMCLSGAMSTTICSKQWATNMMAGNAPIQLNDILSKAEFDHVLMREVGDKTLALAAAWCFPVDSSWADLELLQYVTNKFSAAWGFEHTHNGHHTECDCTGKSLRTLPSEKAVRLLKTRGRLGSQSSSAAALPYCYTWEEEICQGWNNACLLCSFQWQYLWTISEQS